MLQHMLIRKDQMLSILKQIILSVITVRFFLHRIHLEEMVLRTITIIHISTIV